jgi:hypothetical protein
LFQFECQSVFDGKENKCQKHDEKCNTIRHQERNSKVDVRWRTLGGKVIQRAGENGECDGKIEEEHAGFILVAHEMVPEMAFKGCKVPMLYS